MSAERDGLRKIAAFFLSAGGAVLVLSFVACILIQGVPLDIPQIFGFIAYFGGPLPIIPAGLAAIAVFLFGISLLMK